MKNCFTKKEIALWLCSAALIAVSSVISKSGALELTASLVGVTSLIFCAKGKAFGQVLMILFSCLYGIISLRFGYYGELATYVGMTLPMSVLSLISWVKNPSEDGSRVKSEKIHLRDILIMCVLAAAVTAVFFFILRYFNTQNLTVSTISVTTSFCAAFLTFKRSPFFALAYALNDIVVIILWVTAALKEPEYFSTAICFTAFLANDIYGFYNWRSAEKNA